MSERRIWSPEEDSMLKQLKQKMEIGKWSAIAKKLTTDYNMIGRTGKQCRQRYHNHLDDTILRTEWTYEEEQLLYNLHDKVGNKWAIIAKNLPGRTPNCIKNHFYSKLRKGIRKLNRVIHQHFRKEFKQIKISALYKIVETTEYKFKANPKVEEEVSQKCCRMKKMLLELSENGYDSCQSKLDMLADLIKAIIDFSNSRRKTKKPRRNTVQGQEPIKHPKIGEMARSYCSDYESEESDDSIGLSYGIDDSFEFQEPQLPNENKLQVVQEQGAELKLDEQIDGSITISQERYKVQNMLRVQGLLKLSAQFSQPPPALQTHSCDEDFEDNYDFCCMLSESLEGLKLGQAICSDVQMDQNGKLFHNT